MVFQEVVEAFKQAGKEKKARKEKIRKALRDISAKALDVSLKEREKASLRIAKKEIKFREERKERLLKQKFAKDPLTFGSVVKGAGKAFFAPSAPVSRTGGKKAPKKKRISIDEALGGGLA